MTTYPRLTLTGNMVGAAKPANAALCDAQTMVLTPPADHEKRDDDLVDALSGPVPTWRMNEEPIYLEVVAALGIPGLSGPGGPVMVADRG